LNHRQILSFFLSRYRNFDAVKHEFEMDPPTRDEDTSRTTIVPTELEEEPAASSDLVVSENTLPATNALSKLFGSDSDSEVDAPVQAPRGQLLTRLQPRQSDGSSESEDDDDGEGAYERIKNALMSGQDARRKDRVAKQSSPLAEPSSTEDEDDMPVKTNAARRKLPPKESTPSPTTSSPRGARSRQSSPGLFVTPTATPIKTAKATAPRDESESDASTKRNTNRDLQERVKRIRAQRQAAERKEREEAKRAKNARRLADQESDSDPDGENGRRLTQQTRPTRKAGKKALEEMARDQQRISRNMQLAHQAKTKKKYGTKDLFARFGFNQPDTETPSAAVIPTPDPSFPLQSSDVEISQHQDTPPTSPPSQEDIQKHSDLRAEPTLQDRDDETHATSMLFNSASPILMRTDKGKGRAAEFQHLPPNPSVKQSKPTLIQRATIGAKPPAVPEMIELSDSDDDLRVVKTKSRFPVFDRLPQRQQQEAPSMLHLRHLAHVTSPSKKLPKGRSGMSISDLQFSLGLKARQQAQKARQEKIEELKRRGIHIETEEEREKHQVEIGDLVAQFEKARQDDLKLSKLERAEAKKNGEGGDGLASSDESEDEDYVASDGEHAGDVHGQEEDGEDEEVELSGSEDEDMDDADDEEDPEDEDAAVESNGLIDDAAGDDEDGEEFREALEDEKKFLSEDLDEDDASAPIRKPAAKRSRNIIIDEEDDSQNEVLQEPVSTMKLSQPSQTQGDDAMAAFGFGKSSETLGLTQMFAGTMADVDADSKNAHPFDKEPEQDSLDFLRALPDSQPSPGFSQTADLLVPNSQAFESQEKGTTYRPVSDINLGISQLIETSPAFSHTQLSQDPEPTQDVGFKLLRSPAGLVPPPSTVETVMVPVADSPVVKRKGKLQQGRRTLAAELSDVDDEAEVTASELDEEEELHTKASDAFAALKKGAKKQKRIADNFNKKTSWARDAIEEQAEESEDEYAGIGGASDEDSGEDDEELKKMIDESDVKVDERQIAAFFA
jgi:mediator of replication checkpoint protein 1